MRSYLVLLLIPAGPVRADDVRDNQPVRVTEAPNPRLEEVMLGWAKAANDAKQLHCTVRCTTDDQAFGTKEVSSVEVWYRKRSLLRVDLKDNKGNPAHLYCKGKQVHFFNDGSDCVFNLSPAFGFPEDPGRYPDTFLGRLGGGILERLSWLSGSVLAKSLRDRFDVRLSKEDTDSIHLELSPRKARDKSQCDSIHVVLAKKGLWMLRLEIKRASTTDTYDFEKPDTTTPVTAESIVKGLPVGWKRVEWPESATIP
jgi:hypothetical protein